MDPQVLSEIKDARKVIQDVEAEIEDLQGFVRHSPQKMLKTFGSAEARAIRGKLRRAEQQLQKAESATNDDEVGARIIIASNILNSALVLISSEVADFNREMLRFQSEAVRAGTWARHEDQVKRTHEKFMIVAKGVVDLLTRIPRIT